MHSKPKLAIDVGGVLVEKKDVKGPDTNFDLDHVKWIPGALEALPILASKFDLHILSFCGKKTEQETREALANSEIISKLIPRWKWIFTRERAYKVDRMLERDIGILIDDTQEIIDLVYSCNMMGIHFTSPRYPTWDAVVDALMTTGA